jgi:Ca2+-binding EF-hand superfamily protein
MKRLPSLFATAALASAWALTPAFADHHNEGDSDKKKDKESAESTDQKENDQETPARPDRGARGERPDGARGERPDGDRPPGGGGFEALDANGDGSVSTSEFLAAQIERANEAFTRMDSDGDGSLSQDEAPGQRVAPGSGGGGGGAAGQRPPGAGGRPGGQGGGGFAALDSNGDGIITEKEFIEAGANRQKEMFAQIDVDENGKVTEEEMQTFYQRMRERFSGRGGQQGGARPGGPGGQQPGQGGGNPRPPRPE